MKSKDLIDPIDMHVGERLRLARNLRRVSQEQLAALEGITFQQIQKYESGINRLSSSRLVHFAMHLRFPIGWFYESLDMSVAERRQKNESRQLEMSETHRLLGLYYAIEDQKSRKTIMLILRSITRLMANR